MEIDKGRSQLYPITVLVKPENAAPDQFARGSPWTAYITISFGQYFHFRIGMPSKMTRKEGVGEGEVEKVGISEVRDLSRNYISMTRLLAQFSHFFALSLCSYP